MREARSVPGVGDVVDLREQPGQGNLRTANESGYCGIGGSGVSCPIGLVRPDSE